MANLDHVLRGTVIRADQLRSGEITLAHVTVMTPLHRRKGTDDDAAHECYGRVMLRVFSRLRERRRKRLALRAEMAARRRSSIRAGELPSDGDTADRNVVGGALSQRPH